MQLYHELEVLAKAIHFKNLSAAALHVGLSQPQLSRIIAKLEEELKIVLLDRSAKRKSGWTPLALQIAEIYEKNNKRMEAEINASSKNEMVAELHIGTLEGLSGLALGLTRACFEKVGIKKISLDIYDLGDLEANFLSGNLDLILTSKSPGRQKFRHLEEVGYQDFEDVRTNKKFGLFSTFEYNRTQKKTGEPFEHVFISNSLAIKKEWLRLHGGTAKIPGEPRKGRAKDKVAVLLVGSELLSPVLWKQIAENIDVE